MKLIKSITLLLVGATSPLSAQTLDVPDREAIEKFADETTKALGELITALKPKLDELVDQIGDLSAYEAPEVLPNGDIIIRRKPRPLPPPEDGQVDL